MRIVINDLAASKGGALTVLLSFYNEVVKDDTENEWFFLLSDRYICDSENVKVIIIPDIKKNWIHKLMFDFIFGKKIIDNLNPDYIISFQNIITFGAKQKQAVYIHQAIPFQKTKRFSFLKRNERLYAVYQYLIGSIIKFSIRNADKVFVQTEWMKKAICELRGINKEKIVVVPIKAVNDKNHKTATERRENEFFYPASIEAVYKNHGCIYRACEILKSSGIEDFKVYFTLEHEPSVKKKEICNMGVLNRESMIEYYQRTILIFPSYIETVGLPLVEAMQEEAIILAADCEYSHEILDGYLNAYYFDPFIPNQLAELMEMVIKGKICSQKNKDNDNHIFRENKNTDFWKIIMNNIKESVRDYSVEK